jgi:hypothetical protein
MPNPNPRRARRVGSVPVVGRVRLAGVDDGGLDGDGAEPMTTADQEQSSQLATYPPPKEVLARTWTVLLGPW